MIVLPFTKTAPHSHSNISLVLRPIKNYHLEGSHRTNNRNSLDILSNQDNSLSVVYGQVFLFFWSHWRVMQVKHTRWVK